MLRLVDLEPEWWADTPARVGQGISFACPHCAGSLSPYRIAVAFSNPLDGSSSSVHAVVLYARRGFEFDDISIEPRIYVPRHLRALIAGGGVYWEAA